MIVLDKNYSLECDKYNWTLKYVGDPEMKEVNGEEKEVRSRDQWHYATLRQALKAYSDKSIKTAQPKDLQDVIRHLLTVDKTIRNVCP